LNIPAFFLGWWRMSSFIGEQLTKYINKHIEGVGSVQSLEVGRDIITASVNLSGESEPLQLELGGIRWSTSEGTFHLHFHTALASKPWIQGVLNIVAQKTGKRISFPDRFSLAPVKMMFPKA
jgi:hypothetical protein